MLLSTKHMTDASLQQNEAQEAGQEGAMLIQAARGTEEREAGGGG